VEGDASDSGAGGLDANDTDLDDGLGHAGPDLDLIWNRSPLLDLDMNACRFVTDNPGDGLATYCAAPVSDGGPWCPAHAKIVWMSPERRAEARRRVAQLARPGVWR
jgi:hypothetical protein